jgi:hypothetical protein
MAETLSIAPVGEVVKIVRHGVPTSSAVEKLELEKTELEEYASLCEELGIVDCSDLLTEKLKAVLLEENIHVYNSRQVYEFLDQEIGDDWEWRGLRPQDVKELGGWKSVSYRKIAFSKQPYRGAVPLPVLLTVKKVSSACPDVYFYVSSPKGDDGDPFLMVTAKNIGSYIIERWDEPNFRER